MATRCLVIDDHALTRDGTAAALRGVDAGMEVLEAATLGAAFELLACGAPVDLILLDLDLGDSQGVATLEALAQWQTERALETRVVVLSGRAEPELVRQVIGGFGTGFILKAMPREIFQQAISLTLAGGVFIPDVVLRQMSPPDAARSDSEPAAVQRTLTARENEVAALLIQGLTYKRIAKALERVDGKPVSEHTVRAHVGNIAWKLGVTENAKSGVMAEIARRGLVFPRVPT